MLCIVDYGAGNLGSVVRACEAVGGTPRVSSQPGELASATRIIFPGVGAAPSALRTLAHTGLDKALLSAFQNRIPILGICIGAQLILESSAEGNVKCLELVPGHVERFSSTDPSIKVPHIGWNNIRITRPHPLLEGIQDGDEFYFVHSYYPRPTAPDNVAAVSEHGERFCCAISHQNLFATQFHPEKSGELGLKIIRKFLTWDGTC